MVIKPTLIAPCLNQTIIALDCRDPRLLKQSFSDFENHLIGKQLTGTKRIGKYLFIRTFGGENSGTSFWNDRVDQITIKKQRLDQNSDILC